MEVDVTILTCLDELFEGSACGCRAKYMLGKQVVAHRTRLHLLDMDYRETRASLVGHEDTGHEGGLDDPGKSKTNRILPWY